MNSEIICVGSEILIGDILNTHSQFLSRKLASLGINVFWHTSVGDNEVRLQKTVEIALKRSDIIIITGGLGPTQDDLTKQTVAKAINKNLVESETLKNELIEKFKIQNKNMPLNNLKQAQIFENATIFKNSNGTAPGLALTYKNSKTIILLPGPPCELIPMFENEVECFLQKLKNCTIKSKNIYIYGPTESEVDEKIGKLLSSKNPSIGIYSKPGEVRLRISCQAKDDIECKKLIDPIVDQIEETFKDQIFGIDIDSMENALVQTAISCKKTIAVAESCTGGAIASRIVSIEHASKCFKFSTVCYNNEMKQKILGIDSEILEKFGAVSAQVAQQMAASVRLISNSDIGISTTGIASHGGEESAQKPLGLVFVGLSTKEKTIAFKLIIKNNKSRKNIIHQTTLFAMNIARQMARKLK